MKAFRFPLERALQVRRIQLEAEQAQLQKLNGDLRRVETADASIRKFGTDTRKWISDSPALESTTVSTMNDFQRQAKLLIVRMERQKTELAAQSESQKKKIVEFERRVKLLEKLRAQRHASWGQSVQKDEENFAADAYLARWPAQH